jgi:hypothetical protein
VNALFSANSPAELGKEAKPPGLVTCLQLILRNITSKSVQTIAYIFFVNTPLGFLKSNWQFGG